MCGCCGLALFVYWAYELSAHVTLASSPTIRRLPTKPHLGIWAQEETNQLRAGWLGGGHCEVCDGLW